MPRVLGGSWGSGRFVIGEVPLYSNPVAGSAAIHCIGVLDVIRKEAWPFYRTSSGVRLLGARRT